MLSFPWLNHFWLKRLRAGWVKYIQVITSYLFPFTDIFTIFPCSLALTIGSTLQILLLQIKIYFCFFEKSSIMGYETLGKRTLMYLWSVQYIPSRGQYSNSYNKLCQHFLEIHKIVIPVYQQRHIYWKSLKPIKHSPWEEKLTNSYRTAGYVSKEKCIPMQISVDGMLPFLWKGENPNLQLQLYNNVFF